MIGACYTEAMHEEVIATNQWQLVGKSKNGVSVVYDPVNSNAATHFEDTPQLKELVTEALKNIELTGQKVAEAVDMGRVVGTSDVVDVDSSDEIVYGVRKNRDGDGLVPFTKTRQGKPCSLVAIHLVPQANSSYVLSSAWIGPFNDDDEPFPQSANATEGSIDFWDKHAFVYGSQEIVNGSETTIRPWGTEA